MQALITGTVTPFGDNVRLTVKILDTETAKIIGASTANLAKTKAIEELLARGIESSQLIGTQQHPVPATSSYSYGSHTYPIVEDSYLRIVVLHVKKSGNKFVTIQLEYQNKTDKELKVVYGYGDAAILFDNMGNKSKIHETDLPSSVIPAKGKKNMGLGFEFDGRKELGNDFSLAIEHRSNPPGPVSFSGLISK